MLKIKLVKSTIGTIGKHKRTLEALGLRKINQTIERPNNEAVKGMIRQISYLVEVEEK